MSLEVFVRGETETLHNSHGCSRVRAQTTGERAHAEQNIGTGILQNRTNDFLAFWTEMSEFLGETSVRGRQPRLRPFTSHDLGRIAYRMAACQTNLTAGWVGESADDGNKPHHLLQGAFSPSRGLYGRFTTLRSLRPIAELADALKQRKRRFLAPRSRRDFIATPVKLFAKHGEKNDHDRRNDRSQEQPQKSKGFYSAKDEEEQY